MAVDLEKAELPVSNCIAQDSNEATRGPRSSTIPDEEPKPADVDTDSIHSHSSNATAEPVPTKEYELEQRTRSRASSTRSRPISIIPRSKRRGLLGRFTVVPEVENPMEYKRSMKWFITALIALAGAAAPMGSAIFFPSLPELSKDLGTTPTITNLSVAMYMLSLSIFPLWWSSFSETLGRRTIYIVSFSLFTIWCIVAAISTSIGMLIVIRILAGGAAASVQAVGAGTIADIWEVKERGAAMGYFYLGPLVGPLIGPIIGGALAEKWGWRSTQWFLAIYGGVLLFILTFCLPETLAVKRPLVLPEENASTTARPELTRVSTRQSVHIKTKKAAAIFKRCIIDPLSVLAYLRFPAVFFSVYLASIAFGSLYCLSISIQDTFSQSPYNYSVVIIGVLYVPNAVGYFLASILGGRWMDRIMHRRARAANRYDENGKLVFLPEDRLGENAWLAAVLYPGALLWYGWTAQNGVFVVAPMIANFFFGIGSMIVFGTVTTMLTEMMPKKSSSGVAVNNFVRNIFSCVGGVISEPIISAIGNGWLFTILALLGWISALGVVWSMRHFGPRWRIQMDKAMNS